MKLKSESREIVESFPKTDENYSLALESLKERYGRKDLLIDFYVRELLKLVLNNTNRNKNDSLSYLYNKLSAQLRALSSLGVNSDMWGGLDGEYSCSLDALDQDIICNDIDKVGIELSKLNEESVKTKTTFELKLSELQKKNEELLSVVKERNIALKEKVEIDLCHGNQFQLQKKEFDSELKKEHKKLAEILENNEKFSI
ncbi:uncharacterized protein TNCV_1073321 [Trichonephila clavipes]|nr:uncharacterized protein TNCV_1073321 [Trichonephila clavipes]